MDINAEEFYIKYFKALAVLQGKFDALYQESLKLGEDNPIEHRKSRLKSLISIKEKLLRKKSLDFTIQNVEKTLNDVAGVRIVCPFLSDVEKIVDYVNKDKDIKVIEVKDYITNPKESGYSSYHMIVEVPIEINEVKETVKAEIQIRTLAQDVIASLDHKIRYKKNIFISEVEKELKNVVELFNKVDKDLNMSIQEERKKRVKKVNFKTLPKTCSEEEFALFKDKYEEALIVVEKKMNAIKNEYVKNGGVNPIEHVKGRIKTVDSIVTKLEKKEKEVTLENIEKYINDVGAIKVVCSFLSDVYEIIDRIEMDSDFVILDRQDYISNPKECGYASYHFVVAVPVELNNEVIWVKTEIQVRSIIMDFWADVEHILCYQKEVDADTKAEMKRIAGVLHLVDPELDRLAKSFYEYADGYDANDITDNAKVNNIPKTLVRRKIG